MFDNAKVQVIPGPEVFYRRKMPTIEELREDILYSVGKIFKRIEQCEFNSLEERQEFLTKANEILAIIYPETEEGIVPIEDPHTIILALFFSLDDEVVGEFDKPRAFYVRHRLNLILENLLK